MLDPDKMLSQEELDTYNVKKRYSKLRNNEAPLARHEDVWVTTEYNDKIRGIKVSTVIIYRSALFQK